MAAYAALVSVINNIQQIMIHHRFSTCLDYNKIHPLQEKSGLLLDFIEGFNCGWGSKEALDLLERKIASVAHAAEDVIESHIVDHIHARSNQPSVGCTVDLQHLIEEMDAILKEANELKDDEGLREEQVQPTHSDPTTPLMDQTAAMVGCEDELIQLMDELTNQRSSRHIISIVGMGGMGKTTLAQNVYQNSFIKQHFDIRAWATVSQKYDVKEILSQLISGLGKSSNRTLDGLGEQLHKTLFGRRYLIILDDVWDVQVWDKVRCFLPDNGNGSRIVLTTRLSNVANAYGPSCLSKHLLSEKESWELFCEKAFQRQDCPPQLEKVGKEIVKFCKGLPLSIVVIGRSLLKSPRTIGHWKNVAEGIKAISNSEEKQESYDVLLSSYHHLPPHLKPCFLYIGAYKCRTPKIHVSDIIKLWVAEGFLKLSGSRVLEEIAEDYLKDLIDRNLISVGRRYDNGKMKSCDIHDLLRDLCLKIAAQEGFFYLTRGIIRGTERRLIYAFFEKASAEPTLARTILAYEVRKQEMDIHRLLRILDVSYHESVEESFGCVNLRYLALWKPNAWGSERLWEIPTSVSLAWNLQTLIVREAWFGKGVVAPIEIWKMRQLRHVKCPEIYLPYPSLSDRQDDSFVLENLQTLKTLVNFRLSEEMCKIIPNIKKLHLVYGGEWQGYDGCMIECLCNLSRLHKLESLKLIDKSTWPSRNAELNKILVFPSSLNKLSLSHCKLHWDDLTMIGSLPLLEVLKLEYNSITEGKQWSPVTGQFLRLKSLTIDYCHLICWNAESCHFPILEKLVLAGLWDLEEIPWGIGEIPTLKLIHVDEHCSSSSAISAVKIKEDQLECQGIDDLQIEVVVAYVEEFIQMVEAEGLTVNNIQLKKL